MDGEIEPLIPSLWFKRIAMIAAGEFGSLENSLRHAGHLLQLAPRPLRHVVRLDADEDTFEALLCAGDLDAAARRLVAQPMAFSIDEGDGTGTVQATIWCPIQGRAVGGRGDSIAAATLAAWSTCLLSLRTHCEDAWLSSGGRGRHKSPPERRLRSS